MESTTRYARPALPLQLRCSLLMCNCAQPERHGGTVRLGQDCAPRTQVATDLHPGAHGAASLRLLLNQLVSSNKGEYSIATLLAEQGPCPRMGHEDVPCRKIVSLA